MKRVMASSDKQASFDFGKYFLTADEMIKVSQEFQSKTVPFLKKNSKKMFTIKGAPEIHGISMTYGPYTGKNYALYITTNLPKEKIELASFYIEIEKELVRIARKKIFWRTNKLIDPDSKETREVEFIPIAFRGDFLLDTLKKTPYRAADSQDLMHFAVIMAAKYIHNIIESMGYSSTYPHIITDFEKEEKIAKEGKELQFDIDLQFVEKNLFWLTECELLKKYAESSLETKIGRGLIKEGIPFLIQFEVKDDFPVQQSNTVLAKPDFVVLSPLKALAVYCDSYQYHEGKKDQILKDRRIDRRLQGLGFDVFRFGEGEITNNLEGCLEEIKSHYMGKEYALSSSEVLLKKISQIPFELISEWERKFVESILYKLNRNEGITVLEERILDTTIKNARKKSRKTKY
jgi:hypothetical protein